MGPGGSSPCSQEPPLIPILSQMNPVHNFTLCFFKNNLLFKINILPSMPRSSELLPPFRF